MVVPDQFFVFSDESMDEEAGILVRSAILLRQDTAPKLRAAVKGLYRQLDLSLSKGSYRQLRQAYIRSKASVRRKEATGDLFSQLWRVTRYLERLYFVEAVASSKGRSGRPNYQEWAPIQQTLLWLIQDVYRRRPAPRASTLFIIDRLPRHHAHLRAWDTELGPKYRDPKRSNGNWLSTITELDESGDPCLLLADLLAGSFRVLRHEKQGPRRELFGRAAADLLRAKPKGNPRLEVVVSNHHGKLEEYGATAADD